VYRKVPSATGAEDGPRRRDLGSTERDLRASHDGNGQDVSVCGGRSVKCAWVCRFYAENAERFLADEVMQPGRAQLRAVSAAGRRSGRHALELSFWQAMRFAAPALMAGNVVLLKHASNVRNARSSLRNCSQRWLSPGRIPDAACRPGQSRQTPRRSARCGRDAHRQRDGGN